MEMNENDMNLQIIKIFEDITFKNAADSDIKRENANINGDTAMGAMLKYGSEGAKQFNEYKVLKPEHSKAHINGDIHIHDLDFYTLTTTCCQIDLKKLFHNGFSTGHGYLREPNDIISYSSLACIAIQSNQNDQHGGQSIPAFDYGLADGVKKTFIKKYFENMAKEFLFEHVIKYDEFDIFLDYLKKFKAYYQGVNEHGTFVYEPVLKIIDENNSADIRMLTQYWKCELDYIQEYFVKVRDEKFKNGKIAMYYDFIHEQQEQAYKIAVTETDKQTYQAMEALVHNLNTMNSRAGAQVPFSSINYGTDTSPEGRMIIKNILLATEAGLGGGETPIFPVQIFKVKEGINYNPVDPNYDMFKLAIRVSAKRMFPNFSFIDAPFNLEFYKPDDYNTEIAYMGCRTRVMANNYDKTRQTVSGRGNLSFTTINLPRLGIEAKGDLNKFYESLDNMMELVFDQLLERLRVQSTKTVKNWPFLMGQCVWIDSEKLGPDDSVAELLKHGTLSCGFIGLAECLVSLIGKHQGESEEAQKLGLEIISHMRKKVDEEAAKTGLNFSLLATPAEGLSGRFIAIDKKKYGIIPGITDKDFYTNSFHVPVYYNISAFKKIKIEAPYHALTNGGHISYIELDGDPLKNLDAFEKIIRYMKESGIGYGAINHPIDRDSCCGYNGIIDDECPKCHRREYEVIVDRIKRPDEFLTNNKE